jgi:type IV fimbrial biogenesis protein FimT
MAKIQKNNKGFSLIELIVTLAVVSILVSIAAPSFMDVLRDNRTATDANKLIATIQLARSEAAKQGVPVTISNDGDDTGNTANQWEKGWIVFTDWNGNGVYDDNSSASECELEKDCLLRTQSALANDLTLTTSGAFSESLTYNPSGFPVDLVTDSFSLCSKNGDTTNARTITISNTGRPSIEQGALSCTVAAI